MKITRKLLMWGALFVLLAALFAHFGASPADALDAEIAVTVLTADGPVTMTMADYLPAAVAGEMPVDFGAEALKAQAVAARTYVLSGAHHENADVCTDSTCCLAWADEPSLRERWGDDYETDWAAVTTAVTATDGQYLSYEGQPIQAVFHASSAGATESSAAVWSPLPYLVSVSSPEISADTPGLVTTVTVTAEEFAQTLGITPDGDPSAWVGDIELEDSGRVKTLTVGGQAFSGTDIRAAFGLRSTAFTLAWDGTAFVFTVSGSGHGVGMSQYGAKSYAAMGWTYDQILAHYYPGTELTVYTPA